jgi:polysaccharide biosynthesis/export protein
MHNKVTYCLSFGLLVLFFTACSAAKETAYFKDVVDATILAKADSVEVAFQKNDIINIQIISPGGGDADKPFNVTNNITVSSSGTSGNKTETTGYLIDNEGNIEINLLGKFKAEGLTKKQLRDNILQAIQAKKLLINPIVSVRKVNYEVTVIGEVGRPTVINVPNEKISLLKALGAAGDITIFGKKENVLLIRELDGKRIVKRLNLNSKDFLYSDFYYLKPNDIVYVEADKNKIASVDRNRLWIPTIMSAVTVLVIILDRVTR